MALLNLLLWAIPCALATASDFSGQHAQQHEGHCNLVFPTFGGLQLWTDEFWECGWRIQRNEITGHCRLLDPRDLRYAWGSLAACRAAFDKISVARGLVPDCRELVILVNGIARSRHSLSPIRRALEHDGRQVLDWSYASTRASLNEQTQRLSRLLSGLRGVRKVSFLTHSFGGLIVRQLLNDSQAPWRSRMRVTRLCMLFPPNHGAHLADVWHDSVLYQIALGPAGESLTTSAASFIPMPSCPFGVITGGRGDGKGRNRRIPGDDDGTVAVAEAMMDGAEDQIVIDVGHTFGMRDKRVIAAVLGYLADGSFAIDPAP